MSSADKPSLVLVLLGVVERIFTLYLLLWMVTSDGSGSFCSDTFHSSKIICLSANYMSVPSLLRR
ncbi:uncharacterized protein BO72DRAFT_194155 [Aspergillus fijiensis CBS 313.89]|uniref:Uncharacterized protein n=1 Tax=Aspergillus fijiensis CBS 313.89 TaxID=1448319 RepID=A0A8G1RK79_9EURO|nr:uncharacterized protein BO72DRAFT_194155 [Aspergillus fijiensis CBS 313.89]RAK74784.1 hypothetical protein BO72DRAFT_194155 [Aspergillus fijiensis CBS 313.89]